MQQAAWLQWAQRLQAIAQAGIAYPKDLYDLERFDQLKAIAVDIESSELGEARADAE